MLHSSMIPKLVEKPAGFRRKAMLMRCPQTLWCPCAMAGPATAQPMHQSSVVFVTHPKPRNTKERKEELQSSERLKFHFLAVF